MISFLFPTIVRKREKLPCVEPITLRSFIITALIWTRELHTTQAVNPENTFPVWILSSLMPRLRCDFDDVSSYLTWFDWTHKGPLVECTSCSLRSECVVNHKQTGTHCLIRAPGPASFHARRVRLNCCWPCAATSSHLTEDQPTSRTSSARSRTRPTGTAWWLRVEKETQTVNNADHQVAFLSAF